MNVLFLPQTADRGPSSRYRVYQLLPWLRQLGIDCAVSPGIDATLYDDIYSRRTRSKVAAFRAIWQRRRADLHRATNFDVIVVQKGFFPGLYAGWERRLAASRPVVFDFDDAIWLPRHGGNPVLRRIHREGAVQDNLRRATAVIAGNEFLADYARQFTTNVTVVPSAVELARYRPGTGTTVGWIGSRSTMPYLQPLGPVFRELNLTPRVIAAGDPGTLGFPVGFRPWQLETEVADLAGLGIGVAPLPDNPWERGKCGVKILQYMACGLPVVATPVGVQRELVRDGVTGFHATTPAEWRDRLRQLLNDAALRQRLGAAGRELVAQCYDVPVAAARVAKVLLASAQTHGMTGNENRKSA